MAELMPDARGERYRQICSGCGKRRMCTDYVWDSTFLGMGLSLCSECDIYAEWWRKVEMLDAVHAANPDINRHRLERIIDLVLLLAS